MKTICKDCKNHKFSGRNDNAIDLWYNHTCLASKVVNFDFVSGVEEVSYRYCRDVNTDGDCKLYEATNQG